MKWKLILALAVLASVAVTTEVEQSGSGKMAITDVKEKYESDLLAKEGVVGVSADLEKNELVVYVEDESVCPKVPSALEGYPVRCEVTGRITV